MFPRARTRHRTRDAQARAPAHSPSVGLIRRARRPRQTRTERTTLQNVSRRPVRAHLPVLDIKHRRCDLRGVHVQTDEVVAFAMVASSHAIVAAARLKHTPPSRVGNRPDLPAEPDITATGSRPRMAD